MLRFSSPGNLPRKSPRLTALINETVNAAAALDAAAVMWWDNADPSSSGRLSATQLRSLLAPEVDAASEIAARLSNTRIKGIFAPCLHGRRSSVQLGSLALVPEVFRWSTADQTGDLVAALTALERGSTSYVSKVHSCPLQAVHDLPAKLPDHIRLVGHRELLELAHQSFRLPESST